MPLDHELKRILDAALAELTTAAQQECDRARQQGVNDGRGLGWEDGREQGRFEGRQQAEQETRAAVDAAVAAALADRSTELAASARLLEAVRALDRARSLSEILDTLVGCAGREAARAGILLVGGDRLRGWRFVGFPELENGSTVDLALADAGVIAEAIRSGACASSETGARAGPPPFAHLEQGHESLAIPIAMADQVVAVLYADQHPRDPRAATVDGSTSQKDADDERAVSESSARSRAGAWPEMLEVLTRHAARCLEALTALKAARALTERPGLDARADARDRDRAQPETDESGASARRYAKLLVSEIKLYHEADVVAGRRERDLATRLGGEIARARALYEQRVPAGVRQRADYFLEELVHTLANGDATLLQLT